MIMGLPLLGGGRTNPPAPPARPSAWSSSGRPGSPAARPPPRIVC